MLIESIIRRKNGTKVKFGEGDTAVEYHFAPLVPGGPHVAYVDIRSHRSRLLSIPEGFQAADDQSGLTSGSDEGEPVKSAPIPPEIADVLKAATAKLAEMEEALAKANADRDVALALAAQAAEVEPTGDDTIDGGEAGDGIENDNDEIDANGDGKVSRAEAVAAYVKKFGREPGKNWNIAKILDETTKEV